jgi:peptide/nickel transport system substrate-binding protein
VLAGESIGDNYDPSVSFQGWGHSWINTQTTETLIDSRTGKIQPWLATEWNVSSDGLVWTFKLRPDVKFHDATPLDAEAVVFNYMRQIDEKHPFYLAEAITRGATLVGVQKVEASGPLEVKFTRSRPSGGMLAQLSVPWAGLLSPTAIQKLGADYARQPVGTGPFVFEKGSKGAEASVTANPNYWGGKPTLGRVVVRAIPDLAAVNAALTAGEVDFATFVDFKDLEGFRKNPKLKVEVVDAANYGYVGVNTKSPKLQDVRVRRALAHAINRQQIIDVVLSGQGTLPGSFVPAPIPGSAKNLENYYPYDAAKAKGLLGEAGASSLSLAIWAPSNGFWPTMAELIQSDLGKVGVTATIEKIDPARFGGQVTEGKHELFIWDATQASADPSEFANSFFLSTNPRAAGRWGFSNKEFDDLLAKHDAEPDETKRTTIIQQMQKLILDEVPQIILYNGRFAGVTSSRVQGFKLLPFRHAVYMHDVKLG